MSETERNNRAQRIRALDSDYPTLTQEVSAADRAGNGRVAPSGGVGAIVERELRAVLGVRPRTGDPKGFIAALQQAFTVSEVSGHTQVTWNPRSYATAIQADLGAITGAQASLHTRAKGTLDQVLPLLDGLMPLRVDFDPENVAATRAVVRSQLAQVVQELGVEGGPRVVRVEQLFRFLFGGPDPKLDLSCKDFCITRNVDDVKGALGSLRDRLGLQRWRINTIEEEQNYTNFLVVLDQVVGLAESWDAQREYFERGGGGTEPFLGTQLVLLSRDLEVIAESVHEVEFAMDSVFLGPAERQVLELKTDAPMFVSELLDWVERFAAEEARQLIEDGGKQGVAAFRPTMQLLHDLVSSAADRTKLKGEMPAAYYHPRVQRALKELATYLGNAVARVESIEPPSEGRSSRMPSGLATVNRPGDPSTGRAPKGKNRKNSAKR